MRRRWFATLCASVAAAYALADDDVTQTLAAATETDSTQTAAAASPPAEKSLIEEIVVEGERDDTTLKDTSHSVAVFTEEQLTLGTERNMTELFPRVPNVTTDPFNGRPIIRGMAQNGIDRGVTWIPNSGSIVDGQFSPSEPNLWDTRQAEVQRGPENFIGGGGMGGLDATLTNDPGAVAGGTVNVTYAPDSDDESLGVAYGGPVTDRLGFRFAGYDRSDHGFTSNPTRSDNNWNSASDSLARLKLVWQPFGDTSTVMRFTVIDRKITKDGSKNAVTTDPQFDPFKRKDFSDAVWRNQDESLTLYGEGDHVFNDRWHTDTLVCWIDQHIRRENDFDWTEQPLGVYRQHQDQGYRAIQTRVFYDDGPWETYFRQYFFYDDLTNARDDVLFPYDYDGDGPAAPIQADARFSYSTPGWWFIGTQFGVRRSVERFTVSASLLRAGQVLHGDRGVSSTRVGTSGNPDDDAIYDFILAQFPQARVGADLNDFNYLPTIEMYYAVSNDVTVGAKYERAARLGGVWFNPVRQIANDFDDEISDSYDAFVRSSAFDGRFTVRANLFYTHIKGQQVYANLSSTPDDAQMLNAQRSHNDGVEVETTWTDGNLYAWLSLGLLEAKFDRVEVGNVDFSGNDFPDAPPWTVSCGLTYRRPSGLFAETDLTLRPETRGDLENNPYVVNERRTLVNARLGYAWHRVEVSLYARNLFDEEYLDYHDSNPEPGAFHTYTPGDPREVGLTISANL